MSVSPPIRRLSSSASSSKGQEDLINAYEAEEERIINHLSRKLEQLREEKIDLENALEAESESHVNRLSRELTVLRLAQQQQQQTQVNGHSGSGGGSISASPEVRHGIPVAGLQYGVPVGRQQYGSNPADPSMDEMLESMRRENEQLRNRLVDTERDYIRISRLNEIYREELIEHRRRAGLSVDNLIGLSSVDPFSQSTHHRSSSSVSSSSPSTSTMYLPSHAPRPIHAVPIPRPPSQIHRPINNHNHNHSEGNTPLSHSPSSSESPFPLSPVTSTNPASVLSTSANTTFTSPPSSSSYNSTHLPMSFATPSRGLSYPSVPPPSLSSSFGSPTVSYHMPHRDHSLSPIEPLSRRNSNARSRGSYDSRRRDSAERGARVAETGTLVPRSRAGSQSHSHSHAPLPATTEIDGELNGMDMTDYGDAEHASGGRRVES